MVTGRASIVHWWLAVVKMPGLTAEKCLHLALVTLRLKQQLTTKVLSQSVGKFNSYSKAQATSIHGEQTPNSQALVRFIK